MQRGFNVKVNYTNNTGTVQHIGNVLLMPGATRLIDEKYLRKIVPVFSADKFLDHSAKDVIAVLADLDRDRLTLVLTAEKCGKQRSTVIRAIEIEIVKQSFNLSDELAEYKVSLSSFDSKKLQSELLAQSENHERLVLVQQELASRADA